MGTDALHVGLMLALTFSTGVIDAAGFLGLDRVFTGNMTGNVAILGMGLAGADGLPIVGPIVALVAFVAGAALAGRVARGRSGGWTTSVTWLLGVVSATLFLAGALALIGEIAGPLSVIVTALLGLAMGIQAGAARQIAAKDLTTVVVTSTLVGLAFDSRLSARNPHPWVRRLLAVALIGVGAVAGALLLAVHVAASVGLAAVVTAAACVIGDTRRRALARTEEEPS